VVDLSPQAQAVFSAWAKPVAVDRSLVINGQALQFQAQAAVAAALRAAADQVVPQPKYSWDVSSENRWIRRNLLAIAAELEDTGNG
jgi:hypothetical protein